MVIDNVTKSVRQFFQFEASGGLLLIAATLLAMLAQNSPLSGFYDALLQVPVEIRVGDFTIDKPLLLWINDGLMAIFFFMIGLEVKREFLVGELSDPARVVLPVVAAIGGMSVPALIYSAINWGDPIAMRGWAIPSATDIAFALGVIALLGTRVPRSLKIFLMTLAIVDDLGAIVIIAVFYTSNLSLLSLGIAALAVISLYVLNRRGVLDLAAYLLITLVLWTAVLKSGVHATLAGVVAAFFIPYRTPPGDSETLLERLEHDLQPIVVFAILPFFAFVNTGISFANISLQSFLHPVSLGIALGLFLGNQIGVMGLSWLTVKLGFARLPQDAGWKQIYGVSMLCGIGFTMSLFIGGLAFEQGGPELGVDDRLGILAGSLLSGTLGYLLLRFTSRESPA
ncbi:MAG: Na+/H+ antiporter NhaA [Gammaproteobacteria bacterium]|nr:Na+/H+ antiporter NhaA [Pseudomonadales bacterium]